MVNSMWAGMRAIVLAITALFLLPLQGQAERDWVFSVNAFGGKAYHSNKSIKFSDSQGGIVTAGTAYDLNLNDPPTFGGKLTAWHLPRQHKWRPQIGLEPDSTSFTADLHPQSVPAKGTATISGFELAHD